MHFETPPGGNPPSHQRNRGSADSPGRLPSPLPGTRIPDRSPAAPSAAHAVDKTRSGTSGAGGLGGVPAVVAGTTTLNAHIGRLYSLLLAIRRVAGLTEPVTVGLEAVLAL